jgi:hypothetical protein
MNVNLLRGVPTMNLSLHHKRDTITRYTDIIVVSQRVWGRGPHHFRTKPVSVPDPYIGLNVVGRLNERQFWSRFCGKKNVKAQVSSGCA